MSHESPRLPMLTQLPQEDMRQYRFERCTHLPRDTFRHTTFFNRDTVVFTIVIALGLIAMFFIAPSAGH